MNNADSSALEQAAVFLQRLADRYQVDPSFLKTLAPSVEQVFREFDDIRRVTLLAVIEQTVERRATLEQGTRELRLAASELRSAHRKFNQNAREFRSSVAAVIRRPTDN